MKETRIETTPEVISANNEIVANGALAVAAMLAGAGSSVATHEFVSQNIENTDIVSETAEVMPDELSSQNIVDGSAIGSAILAGSIVTISLFKSIGAFRDRRARAGSQQ